MPTRQLQSLLGFKSRDLSTSNLWKQVPDLRRTLEFTGDGDLLSDRGITREIELTYPEWRLFDFISSLLT